MVIIKCDLYIHASSYANHTHTDTDITASQNKRNECYGNTMKKCSCMTFFRRCSQNTTNTQILNLKKDRQELFHAFYRPENRDRSLGDLATVKGHQYWTGLYKQQ